MQSLGVAPSVVVITVLFAVIIVIVAVVELLQQSIVINQTIAEYTQISGAKQAAYRFVSCFSTDIYGILSFEKLEKIKSDKKFVNDCMSYEDKPVDVRVEYLDSNLKSKSKDWVYKESNLLSSKVLEFQLVVPITTDTGEVQSGTVTSALYK